MPHRTMRFTGLLWWWVPLSVLAACSAETGADVTSADDALVDYPIAIEAVVTCDADIVPQCSPQGLWGTTCGEGHDQMYTAYDLEEVEGTLRHREIIHHTCVAERPCKPPPITTTVTRQVRTPALCGNARASASVAMRLADDDGCKIACEEHGDPLCCAVVATHLFAPEVWTEITTIHGEVECSRGGCTSTFDATNRGTEANQLAGLRCRVTSARPVDVTGPCPGPSKAGTPQ